MTVSIVLEDILQILIKLEVAVVVWVLLELCVYFQLLFTYKLLESITVVKKLFLPPLEDAVLGVLCRAKN